MTDPPKTSRRQIIEEYAARRIARIQRAYLDSTQSEGAAWLAELRRSGAEPGSSPATWVLEFEGFPETLMGRRDEPSHAERAVHLALTLYAVHQQSQRDQMHCRGREFGMGRAVAKLLARSDSTDLDKPPTRFAALATADTFGEISHYARQLITQLRSASIPLDYGTLTGDLYQLQNPKTADSVRRVWGLDFAKRQSLPTNQPTVEKGQ